MGKIVLALSGSLRKESLSTKLLRAFEEMTIYAIGPPRSVTDPNLRIVARATG